MRRRHGSRARLGGVLAMALGALALLALPSLAAARDRNHDGIPDRWEKRHHLSLHVNQAKRDQDHDHLNNLGEFKAGDNPRNPDTNDNGVMDGEENAGTIASFDAETGKLTLNLFGGETVSGLVTEETRIQCGHEGNRGDDESGDDENDGSEASISSDGGNNLTGQDGNDGPEQNEEGDEEQGNDEENEEEGDEQAASCSPKDLVVGATVASADLSVRNGKATFEEIDLAP
jgi:hypothetical protein